LLTPPNDGIQKENKLDLRVALKKGAGQVKTDAKSGIINDANDYANETIGDPRYPFDLLCRVITVSLETVKIVKALPELDI
jgi:hypothetical protein